MRSPKRSLPRLECLEDRALLSEILPRSLPANRAVMVAARSTRPVSLSSPALQGTATGNYFVTPARPGIAANYQLSGAGSLNAVGEVQVAGVITTSFARGRPVHSGLLTLKGAQGTVYLRVQGITGSNVLGGGAVLGFPSPSTGMILKYSVMGGTGVFQRVNGSGTAALALKPSTPVVPPGNVPVGQGTGGSGGVLPSSPFGSRVPPAARPPATPLGGPTFQSGTFTLSFNNSPAVWPPTL